MMMKNFDFLLCIHVSDIYSKEGLLGFARLGPWFVLARDALQILVMKKGIAAGLFFLFCLSLIFIKVLVPDSISLWQSVEDVNVDQLSDQTLDEDAINAFNEYASAVLNASGEDANENHHVHGPAAGPSPALRSSDIHDLFTYGNLSYSQRKVMAVWSRLKRVALRSDLFSEAKNAILEAVNAWEELLEAIDRDKMKHAGSSYDSQCSYSVRSVNSTLQIPCGLILDSSISFIGVPSGAFQISLMGLRDTESKPSSILNYDVRLGGDSSTYEAVIVQKSGNSSSEERCPSLIKRKKTVDGLNACFQQIRTTASRKNPRKKGPNWPRSAADQAQPFPFTEGLPFVATIWLGWHGFHMTVNGKHITSFEYRQEPWLVNAVEITGDLQVFSFMANGLPVSEDRDLLPDLDYLKAPLVSSKLALFVGVFSTANNMDRRMAIRRSWMQYDAVRSGDVVVRFFVGLDNNPKVNLELWAEAISYNDTQLLPFVDHYELITLKTLAISLYAVKVMKANFIMKADDDTFVRIDEILSLIRDANPKTGLLLGLIEYSAKPNREKSSKWYISEEEWPYPYYPPWAHGAGYLISSELGKYIVHSHENSQLKLFKLEDVAMGIWISDYTLKNKRVEYVNHDKFLNLACASGYVIAHYQKPKGLLCLWQHLQRGRIGE